MNKPLSIRGELFVSYLAQGKPGSVAADLAGYAPGNVDKLLKTTRISQRLAQLRADIASRATLSTVADLKERKEKLTEILRAALKEGEVNPSHKIAAADILNKIDRLYAQDAPRETETYTTFIFVMPDGTKVRPRELIGGITKDAIQGQGKSEELCKGGDEAEA